ncbi:hypothetical protein [Ferrovibrio terrae]|uniref:hypothetical protein n=1 Tax=Ferrovibrio terrae TaxID=2594003 RepID=UPI003137F432
MRFRSLVVCVLLVVSLSACSAALVPLSFDPKTKLGQAYQLMYEFDRPLPAERLIQEAYDIYLERGDYEGMGTAYQLYGFFFVSRAVVNWSHVYARAGFFDGSAYKDRFHSSAAYFERSANLFMKIDQFDSVTSVLFNGARSYVFADERDKACSTYDRSLEYYRKNIAANPGVKVTLPAGYSDYEVLVRDEKVQAKCP